MNNRLVVKGREVMDSVRNRPRFILLAAAALLVVLWLIVSATWLATRSDHKDTTIESQQLLIDKLATQLDEARAQGAAVPAPEVIAAETPGADVSPAVGVQGERGDAGPAGVAGEPGVGVAGEKGDVGATGVQGDPGTAGAQGAPGIGVAGANGTDGAAGPAGSQGDPGASGVSGPAGPAGADGQPGTPGANGADGAPGAAGAPGLQGPPPSSFTFSIGPVNYQCDPSPTDPTVFTCAVVP